MKQRLMTAAAFLILVSGFGLSQEKVAAPENPFTKNNTFKMFKDVVPGIDFYAGAQADFDAYVKPITDARQKIAEFTGGDLASGAIFVCSKLAQKDAVFDQRVYRMGYKWYLIQLTSEAQREERQARMASAAAQATANGIDVAGLLNQAGGRGGQRGGQDQTGRQGGQSRGGQDQTAQARGGQDQAGQRGGNAGGQRGGGPGGPGGGQEARAALALAQNAGYAILTTSFEGGKPFRLSRVDDVTRTPLVDWIDIALVAYATGSSSTNLRFLQDHLEEAFPLDDVLAMSRPFVAQQDPGGGGGAGAGGGGGGGGRGGDTGGMTVMVGGAGGGAAATGADRQGGGGGGGGRGGGGAGGAGRVLPKDVQDRMLFDGQAASFFNYLIAKVGIDKTKDVVRQNVRGTESFTVLQGMLGSDFEKVEKDWVEWLKTQK